MAQRERNYSVRSQLSHPTDKEELATRQTDQVVAQVSGPISVGSNQDAGSGPLS